MSFVAQSPAQLPAYGVTQQPAVHPAGAAPVYHQPVTYAAVHQPAVHSGLMMTLEQYQQQYGFKDLASQLQGGFNVPAGDQGVAEVVSEKASKKKKVSKKKKASGCC
eukprot:TRINITY_DN18812_c0_g1_i1.p1 TRINITY_DN18812_c0_g1~~TRINITY_DN18812_c0_g1_i1.p1  ORF type:complete len:107 (-),score=32.94 TRINITY_DN18812_c0_g1_i1:27-347(-)